MHAIDIPDDISVFGFEVIRFPEDIGTAFQKLLSLFRSLETRKILGISRPNQGKIHYFVAAEEMHADEFPKSYLQSFTLPKGTYMGIWVRDYAQDPSQIGKAFEHLIALPNLDPMGYCIEWYQGEKDVLCMLRLHT